MKRFLSVLLATLMVLSCTVIVSAEDSVIEITKQPTTVDPSVEVSDAKDVIYQWQTLGGFAEGEITLENAAVQNVSAYLDLAGEVPADIELEFIAETSSYNEETGWSPAVLGITQTVQPLMSEPSKTMYACLYFSAFFADNSIATFEIPEGFAPMMVALADMNSKLSVQFQPNDEGTAAVAEIEAGGFYTLIVITEAAEILDLTVYGTVAGFEDIEDETESTLSKVEVGNSYRCVITSKDGSTLYTDVFSAVYEIIKQPTASDPSVEVTFEKDASFQWYEFEESQTIVDDTMIDTENTYGSTYNPETQEWTPFYGEPSEYAGYMEYLVGLFYMYLSEGDTVRITISNPDAISPADPEFRFYNCDTDNDNYIEFVDGVLEFTAEEDGLYDCYQYGISPETATYKVEVITYSGEKMEGETEKTLKSFELGKYYAVEATYSDDTVLASEIFEMEYAITKQPTAEDPSVEVNFEEDVEGYQWYSIAYNESEVTDEIADPAYFEGDSEGEPSYYDEENECWVGSLYGTYTEPEGDTYYEYDAFYIDLSEGQTIAIIPSEEIIGRVYVSANLDFDYDEDKYWQYEDGVYYYTAPADGNYDFYADTYSEEVLTFKAYTTIAEVTAIEGESESVLKNAQVGLYACVVTYKNGAELISDAVTILHKLGDVNADGKIDQYDYILVKRHYFETRLLTEGEMTRADANKDGKVDQFDYILIARHYFGTFVIK